MNGLDTETWSRDFRTIVRDTEALLKATAGQADEKISAARSRAESSLRDAQERLSELRGDWTKRAKRAARRTDAYVQENPWRSVGAGLAAGAIIGALAALVLRRSD